MTASFDLRNTVLLSLQRAMLGEIFDALHAVNVEINPNAATLLCYVDDSISECDRESLSEIETELLADLPAGYTTQLEIIIWPRGLPISDRGIAVYRRKQ